MKTQLYERFTIRDLAGTRHIKSRRGPSRPLGMLVLCGRLLNDWAENAKLGPRCVKCRAATTSGDAAR